MKKFNWIILIAIYLIIGGAVFVKFGYLDKKITPVVPTSQTAIPTETPVATTPPKVNALADPVADFKSRVTKKPFGIYITHQNSPIQPERFTGYHTGADAEYQDVTADVPVYAVTDGTVVLSETASGYGGVLMLEIEINGAKHNVLYGHIRPSSLPKIRTTVTKGEQIALLGTGYSSETDGERRHLHFAVLSDTRLDIKGYVSKKADLSGWIDPLSFFN